MPDRPIQGHLDVQLLLPPGSIVTVEVPGQVGVGSPVKFLKPHETADLAKHYPKEPAVAPVVINRYVQGFRDFGVEHEETILAREKLDQAIALAASRGFSEDDFLSVVEDTLFETRRKFEGRVMGTESVDVKILRADIEDSGLREWYPDEPLSEAALTDEPYHDDLIA